MRGTCHTLAELPPEIEEVLAAARRAVLVTTAPTGTPRPVPVCFAVRSGEAVTAVDHKPKSSPRLARLADVRRTGRAVLLVDRWDEDWTRLAWIRIEGRARLDAPGSAADELRARYPQYEAMPPAGEVIALTPERILWWTAAESPGSGSDPGRRHE